MTAQPAVTSDPPPPPPEPPRVLAVRIIPDPKPEPSRMGWCVRIRLALNLLLGLALLTWLYVFTEVGDYAVTLLTLGGIFSWVAVVMKLLTAEYQEQIRRLLAGLLYETRLAWCTVGGLFTALILTGFSGSLEVVNLQGGDARVRVYFSDGDDARTDGEERIAAGGRVRTVFWTGWSAEGQRVKVEAGGLPTAKVTVRPWKTERVAVPGSFLKPGVLILTTSIAQKPNNKDDSITRIRVIVSDDAQKETVPHLVAHTSGVFVRATDWSELAGDDPTEIQRRLRLQTELVDAQFPPTWVKHDLKPGDTVVAERVRVRETTETVIERSEMIRIRWPERDGIQVAILKLTK